MFLGQFTDAIVKVLIDTYALPKKRALPDIGENYGASMCVAEMLKCAHLYTQIVQVNVRNARWQEMGTERLPGQVAAITSI